MLRSTPGQILVNDALPEDLRDHNRVIDGKSIRALLQDVADRHPDKYVDVVKKLSDVGREAAYATGGFSFGLNALRPAKSYLAARDEIRGDIARILASDMSEADKGKAVLVAAGRHQKPLEDAIYKESLEDGNPLALQVLSGSRGKPMNLKSLRGADLLYNDHRDQLIPIPVLRGFGQGLSAAEYFASTFGSRKGLVDVKFATRDAGYFGKQLSQAAHRLVVTALDADGDGDPDAAPRGMPVDTSDPDNAGALLAHPAGGYPRNAHLTPRVLKDLTARGVNRILVRSPITAGPPGGGVYARDVGVRERGGLAPLGDMVGMAAAQAIGEPVSQGGLSSKHSGGVAGAAKTVGGFKALNQQIQVPEGFAGGAAHAEADGRVQAIKPAPAGGFYIVVGGKDHYAPTGLSPLVKVGDEVEAGDVLSEGLPNPAKVVEHKGVGEGRRYFVQEFRRTLKDANIGADRRNVELIARGLVNHVRLTDEVGNYVPDDVVPYDVLEAGWEPRAGTRRVRAGAAAGKYLERPALHYSIGTRVGKKVADTLAEFGVQDIDVHDDPPPFKAEMVRGMENLQHDPDVLARMLGSNLEKSLKGGVHRGLSADSAGTSFVPALVNPVTFNRGGPVKGFDPKSVVMPEPARPAGVLDGL